MNTFYYVGYTEQEIVKFTKIISAVVDLLNKSEDNNSLVKTISTLFDNKNVLVSIGSLSLNGIDMIFRSVIVFKNKYPDFDIISIKLQDLKLLASTAFKAFCESNVSQSYDDSLNLIAIHSDIINTIIPLSKKDLLGMISDYYEVKQAA